MGHRDKEELQTKFRPWDLAQAPFLWESRVKLFYPEAPVTLEYSAAAGDSLVKSFIASFAVVSY